MQRFIAGTRDQTSRAGAAIGRRHPDSGRLSTWHSSNMLHVAPNALGQLLTTTTTPTPEPSRRVRDHELRPTHAVRLLVPHRSAARRSAVENVTAPETAKLCPLTSAPGCGCSTSTTCRSRSTRTCAKSATRTTSIYTEPRLAPGGEGAKPATAGNPAGGVRIHRAERRRPPPPGQDTPGAAAGRYRAAMPAAATAARSPAPPPPGAPSLPRTAASRQQNEPRGTAVTARVAARAPLAQSRHAA